MIRILTHTGLVDVTDEHSLLDMDGEPTDAKYIEIGNKLLHHPYPPLLETQTGISPDEAKIFGMFCGCGTYNWAINNANLCLLEKYKTLCEEVYIDYGWVIMESSGVYKLSPRGNIVAITEYYRSRMYRGVPQEILNSSFRDKTGVLGRPIRRRR